MERTHQSLGFLILPAIGLALCLGSRAGAAPPLEAYGNLPQVEYMREGVKNIIRRSNRSVVQDLVEDWNKGI
jgi:hypothetical protein